MGCISRAVLVIILFVLRLSSVKNAASCEETAQNISTDSEKSHHRDNVLIKAIAVLGSFLTDMNKPHSKDIPTEVLNLVDNLISEISRIDVANALHHFRVLALRHIMIAKKELMEIAQSADSQVNKTVATMPRTTILKKNQHLINPDRLIKIVLHIMDGLINMTAIELRNCCNVTMKSNISLCQSYQSLVVTGSGYMDEMARLLDEIKFCLENPNSNKKYKTRCANLASNEVTNLIEDFDQLMQIFKKLLRIRLLYSKCCILFVLVDVNEQNKNVM